MDSTRKRLYLMACTLNELLASLTVSCGAMVAYMGLQQAQLTMPERIHYETESLGLLDDVQLHLTAMTNAIPAMQQALLKLQGLETETATEENNDN